MRGRFAFFKHQARSLHESATIAGLLEQRLQ